MELYFLRHGIAAEKGRKYSKDSERPLTKEGIKEMERIAKGMKSLGLSFDRVVSSPYVRARQTAEIVAEAFGRKIDIALRDELVPSASFGDFLSFLKEFEPDHCVLFVGHQPSLGEFASRLVSRSDRGFVHLKKGGLCRVDTSELSAGSLLAELVWLLSPEHF